MAKFKLTITDVESGKIIHEKFFEDDPAVAFEYRLRGNIFRERVVIDLGELKKQMGVE